VFPSPARDYITISCHDCQAYQSAGFYLYDFKGERKLHFTGSLEENVRISLNLFSPGIYFLKIIIRDKNGNINYLGSSRVVVL
jgi:hypothetical protein